MSKSGLRLQKSRSMMFSLYSLSGLATLIVIAFVGTLWLKSLAFLRSDLWVDILPLLRTSLVVYGLALVAAVPVAIILTYLATLWWSTRWSKYFHSVLKGIDQAPPILYGFFFLVVFGANLSSLVGTFFVLAVVMITRRWLTVVEKIPTLQIEAAQGLGMNLLQISFLLYIKPHFKMFFIHVLAVLCSLFVLVVPVICFINPLHPDNPILSLELFHQILLESDQVAGLALVLLLIHGVRAYLDQLTSFWEVEFG